MSSVRVRTQNKVLEKFGAAKKSTNIPFDLAYNGFKKMDEDVVALDGALHGFVHALKAFHTNANILGNVIQEMANVKSDDCPIELKDLFQAYKETTLAVDVKALNITVEKYEKNLLKPMQGWVNRLHETKKEINEFSECHMMYDHYTRKVLNMRTDRDKRSSGNKPEKPKDIEKLIRNEQKLAVATNQYNERSEHIIQMMKEINQGRFSTLAPIVEKIIEFRKEYCDSVNLLASDKFQAILDQHYLQPDSHNILDMLAAGVPMEAKKKREEKSPDKKSIINLMKNQKGSSNNITSSVDYTHQHDIDNVSSNSIEKVKTSNFSDFIGDTAVTSGKTSNINSVNGNLEEKKVVETNFFNHDQVNSSQIMQNNMFSANFEDFNSKNLNPTGNASFSTYPITMSPNQFVLNNNNNPIDKNSDEKTQNNLFHSNINVSQHLSNTISTHSADFGQRKQVIQHESNIFTYPQVASNPFAFQNTFESMDRFEGHKQHNFPSVTIASGSSVDLLQKDKILPTEKNVKEENLNDPFHMLSFNDFSKIHQEEHNQNIFTNVPKQTKVSLDIPLQQETVKTINVDPFQFFTFEKS